MYLYQEALDHFQSIYQQAQALDMPYPDAMSLATADADGRPDVRIVLLKDWDVQGFVFYTNQQSRKGLQIAAQPYATLMFYWQALTTQIRISGTLSTVSDEEADAYWYTRPLQSRIGAWASQQSEVISERAVLQQRYDEYAEKFAANPDIPRPAHWSGYRLAADRFEFWSERPFRLHERICYEQQEGVWKRSLLNP
jgi:pyridoxamine 5'-phosphate oxidase